MQEKIIESDSGRLSQTSQSNEKIIMLLNQSFLWENQNGQS